MARDCSDSDSEEERHDRFKSERNPNSVQIIRPNIPSSLDSYNSRARSPLRQNIYKPSRYRSRCSEERRYSPVRRTKSPARSSWDKISPKENKERRSSSLEYRRSKHKHKRSNGKDKIERHRGSSRIISEDVDGIMKNKSKGVHLSENVYNDSEDNGDNHTKKLKKHKRSRDPSESDDNKKRKKEKKHRKKHHKSKNSNKSNVLNTSSKVKEESFHLSEDSQKSTEDSLNSKDLGNEFPGNEDNSFTLSSRFDLIKAAPESLGELKVSVQEEGEISCSESEQFFGPALPPQKVLEKSFGPQLPPEMDSYGPALPPAHPPSKERSDGEEDDGGDVIGPQPVGHASAVQTALDARASMLKNHMDNKPGDEGVPKRESWMLELPEARGAQLGLGPRKFRSKPAPDMSDRSSWTDTPEAKARKMLGVDEDVNDDIDSKRLEILEKNKEMELLAKKSEKKSKSLLEMHQKELKRKKKKEKKERGDKPPERVPFSREKDLQTNRFDEAQKRSIIKKAQLLDSRFSLGESKYL